jgi:hypothetical protein
MKGIDAWRLADEFTLVQAAFLILGYDPSILQEKVDYHNVKLPDGYVAVKHALSAAIRSGKLTSTAVHELDDKYGEFFHVENLTLINIDDLRVWMKSKGFGRHFFFFPEGIAGEFANPNHPRYSAKLAAAVDAWNAMEGDVLKAKTPKQAVQKWLRLEALRYGLTDNDGKPIETAIEEISKVVNWKLSGGAPSSGANSPSLDSAKPRAGSSKLEVLSEKLHSKYTPDTNFSLDDEIPF